MTAKKKETIKKKIVRNTAKRKQTVTNNSDDIKKLLLEMLEKTLGNITMACQKIKINRSTYYDYFDNDINFRKKVKEIKESQIDFVESKLLEKIQGAKTSIKNDEGIEQVYKKEPCTTSIIFYLKTQGKERGYVERQEIEQKQTDEFKNYSDDDLDLQLEKLEKLEQRSQNRKSKNSK